MPRYSVSVPGMPRQYNAPLHEPIKNGFDDRISEKNLCTTLLHDQTTELDHQVAGYTR